MSEHPALRISNIVYGRQSTGNRVRYFLDVTRDGKERSVPETVVLTRWRRRQLSGYKFSGTKLSSTLWRAMHLAFPQDAKSICRLSAVSPARRPGYVSSELSSDCWCAIVWIQHAPRRASDERRKERASDRLKARASDRSGMCSGNSAARKVIRALRYHFIDCSPLYECASHGRGL